MVRIIISVILTLLFTSSVNGQTFYHAKKELRQIYKENRKTFYCGCEFDSEHNIDLSSCGYKVFKNPLRAKRVEWEHIVPVSFFGKKLSCWPNGGRQICSLSSDKFKKFESDLHNIVPSIGEINANRSNKMHGIVTNPTKYGYCDFRINRYFAQPRKDIQGDVARIWLYMIYKYDLTIPDHILKIYEQWNKDDPIDDHERWRNEQIIKIQGDSNIFIK
jgi:deoxyribonuclease-1